MKPPVGEAWAVVFVAAPGPSNPPFAAKTGARVQQLKQLQVIFHHRYLQIGCKLVCMEGIKPSKS